MYVKMNSWRPFIDTNYTKSGDKMQRSCALAIIKPMKNMTGEYSCKVESYQDYDSRAQYLQMIVPETHFYLNVHQPSEGTGIECTVENIYPEPQLKILYVLPFAHLYSFIVYVAFLHFFF